MGCIKKQRKWGCLKLIALFSAAIGLVVIGGVVLINDYDAADRENRKWTEERITRRLGISIPENAANVHFEGRWAGYAPYLLLDFEASPSTLANFTSHFCNDNLYSGYDPFNDIEGFWSADSPYIVRIEYRNVFIIPTFPPTSAAHYSYSPITSENIFGNECELFDREGDIAGWVMLTVDKSNPRNHRIHMEYQVGNPHAYTQMDIQPFEDFPILLRGILRDISSDRYLLYPGNLCIEIDPLFYLSDNEDWSWLVGSTIQIAIDGNNLPEAYISAQGLLSPRYDRQGAPFLENSKYFNYCYAEYWREGEHELEIEVSGTSGQHYALTWHFDTQ